MRRVLRRAVMTLAMSAGLLVATPAAIPVVHADSLETIPLHYRMAEDLLPILLPLMPPGSALTGTGAVLLVRTDASTLQQLRETVANLDRAPRQLLITVGQGTNTRSSDASVRGSGTIGSGDVQVGVNRPPASDTGAQVVVRSGTASDGVHNVSSVRALEGYETYIAVGQSRPFTSTTVSGGGRYPPVVTESTEFRDVQTGFYATPRIAGDRVTLAISPRQQRSTGDMRQAPVSTASVTTTVTGRLGEWMPLGGTVDNATGTSSGLLSRGSRADLTQYSVWVKVDEVP